MNKLKVHFHSDDSVEVNGILSYAKEFAYDGCHKIYLLDEEEQRAQMVEYGYEFYPIADLQSAFDNSCSLRFISNCSLTIQYVKQFEFEESEDE